MKFTYRHNINAVNGPACPGVAEIVWLFTSQRNIPTIGYEQYFYDTFVTTTARYDADAVAIISLVDLQLDSYLCLYPIPF